MDIINKIVNSRIILKDILSDEWNTDEIPILSTNEVKQLYVNDTVKNNILNILGVAGKCSFSVTNKLVDSHKLHVLYYNFPDDGINSSRLTKSILNKVNSLYEKHINYTDNILIIINEGITESTIKISDLINISKQSMLNDHADDFHSMIDTFKKKSISLQSRHFGNVYLLPLNSITVNLFENDYVPKHNTIRDGDDISKILEQCNCRLQQLPIINRYDIMSILKMLTPGDICEISRKSKKSGTFPYYRVCR
tara:strand:+ start:3317 stop:4072 length:756 start_codon:yes stop_codon:yes gene_type:complete